MPERKRIRSFSLTAEADADVTDSLTHCGSERGRALLVPLRSEWRLLETELCGTRREIVAPRKF